MHPDKDAERAVYYRQQASTCASAALTTAIAEVRQAYLDLEQGWLCLAPKVDERVDATSEYPRVSEMLPHHRSTAEPSEKQSSTLTVVGHAAPTDTARESNDGFA